MLARIHTCETRLSPASTVVILNACTQKLGHALKLVIKHACIHTRLHPRLLVLMITGKHAMTNTCKKLRMLPCRLAYPHFQSHARFNNKIARMHVRLHERTLKHTSADKNARTLACRHTTRTVTHTKASTTELLHARMQAYTLQGTDACKHGCTQQTLQHSYIHASKVATTHANIRTLDRTQALRTVVRFSARTASLSHEYTNERMQIQVYARSSS
jgi:hypothetical protein